MMNVGFCGGSSLCEIGTISDVKFFFDCVDFFVVKNEPTENWVLLMDRLYCRYLRFEELSEAEVLMEKVRKNFLLRSSSEVEWEMEIVGDRRRTWLDPTKPSLADVFQRYFQCFEQCVESATLFFNSWNIYQPVKIVRTETAWFMLEKARPLADYDLLEGEPFWAR